MKTKLTIFNKVFVAAAFGLPTLFFSAQQAAAAPSGPLSCAGVFGVGGCAPYGQVIFGTGGTDGSIFEYNSTILDYSATGPTATVRGAVDLAKGTLKAFAQGIEDGNPSTGTGGYVIASGTDVFTLHSTSASGSVTFSVILTADGAGTITNPGYSGSALVQLGVPGGGGGDFDRGTYQAGSMEGGGFPIPGVQFALLSTKQGSQGNQLRASDTHSVLLNNPFSLGYSLRADVSEGTSFDLSNTGHLRFILPAGVTVTSMGGYGVATVPVPAAAWLFGSGLLGLIGVARRKTRHPERS